MYWLWYIMICTLPKWRIGRRVGLKTDELISRLVRFARRQNTGYFMAKRHWDEFIRELNDQKILSFDVLIFIRPFA